MKHAKGLAVAIAVFSSVSLHGQARADALVQDFSAATSPIPALSCLYVSEWNGDAFVDRKGREYSLDELRRREAGAFRKAGLSEAA